MYTVSIVTISQYIRADFLKILAKCITQQDYDNIIEWVIVDTSSVGYNRTTNDLSEIIKEFRKDKNLPEIIYFQSTKSNIGGWRNDYSKLTSGDIIVCMDDDDYYPSTRVSHAVEILADKQYLIAGCDKMHFYDIYFKKMYTFKGFGTNHSTNNCIAYWKDYLTNHQYDEKARNAEEYSFTNSFTENMAQLESDKTILQFSHDTNTFIKRIIIMQNSYLSKDSKYIMHQDFTIDDFITNKEILDDYNKIFSQKNVPKKSEYDIVYYMGASILWSPHQNNLGGSEQAVKYLASEWKKQGKKVAVYGNLIKEDIFEDVDYIQYYKFNFWDKFNTLILWRGSGCYPIIELDLKADKIMVDLHDNDNSLFNYLFNYKEKISEWMFKSQFHYNLACYSLKSEIPNSLIIPNGIRVSDFSIQVKEQRNPYRMCYCSCYTRGLERILKNIWPIIYSLEPRAELHVYYGMDLVKDKDFITEIQQLFIQPGVMDHQRQSLENINREKHLSTFHLYYTDSLAEIDCISIRESLVAGCIPILSNINLFDYRDGIHLKWLPNTDNFNYQIACFVVELMHNTDYLSEVRNKYYNSATIISWRDCATQWLKNM
jgi:hypothetical protein